MADASLFTLLKSASSRKNLLTGAGLRLGFVALSWVIVAIPSKPSWAIANFGLTHTLFLCVLLWSITAFALYWVNKFAATVNLVSTIGVDMILITVLAAYTGGPMSPFVLLYLVEIISVFYLGNHIQGIIVSMAGMLYFAAMTGLALMDIPGGKVFLHVSKSGNNQVLFFSALILFVAAVAITVFLNTLASKRIGRIQVELKKARQNLQNTGDELMSSFHDLESVADKLKEQKISTEATKRNLLKADKYATVGWLAAGVVNEFNNPLTSIISDIEMLLVNKKEKLSPRVRQTSKKVLDCATRIQSLVNNLTQTIRPEGQNYFNIIDLNKLIERIVSLLKLEAQRHSTEVTLDLDANVPGIFAVESQVEQLLINLISNAFESMDKRKGSLIISTFVVKEAVRLKIQDNGRGIAESEIKKVFEPFFSARTDTETAGLGLFIVKEIVDNHNGTIDIKSEPGKYTSVTVFFPIREA